MDRFYLRAVGVWFASDACGRMLELRSARQGTSALWRSLPRPLREKPLAASTPIEFEPTFVVYGCFTGAGGSYAVSTVTTVALGVRGFSE